MSVIAMPTMRAKNIRWSMFGGSDATAVTGFDGTIVFTTCIIAESLFAALVFCASSTVLEASAP
jgi:hypothetical protein